MTKRKVAERIKCSCGRTWLLFVGDYRSDDELCPRCKEKENRRFLRFMEREDSDGR